MKLPLDGHDPALRDSLVHFVGRRRGLSRDPLDESGLPLLTEARLSSILLTRCLRAGPMPTGGFRDFHAVCASDLSLAELNVAFSTGLNARGAARPWAIILDRNKLNGARKGFQPVLYVNELLASSHMDAVERIYGARHWRGLVMPFSLDKAYPNDWLHEREWRWCFPPRDPPSRIQIATIAQAVVVGKSGWEPSWTSGPDDLTDRLTGKATELSLDRWLWDSDSRKLVPDGTLVLPSRGAEPNE